LAIRRRGPGASGSTARTLKPASTSSGSRAVTYLLRAAVLAGWQEQILPFRARLPAIPNNVGARTHPSALRDKIIALVNAQIYAALTEIAGNGEAHDDA